MDGLVFDFKLFVAYRVLFVVILLLRDITEFDRVPLEDRDEEIELGLPHGTPLAPCPLLTTLALFWACGLIW